jgi:hypothetical protein
MSIGEYRESTYPDKIYRVDSYGQIFRKCKPLGIVKTAIGIFYHFESIDPEFPELRGYKFWCFRKEDFTEVTF